MESVESQPQNSEFRNDSENVHPCDQTIYRLSKNPASKLKSIFLLLNQNICCGYSKEQLFFLFLNQNICCGYSKEPSQ